MDISDLAKNGIFYRPLTPSKPQEPAAEEDGDTVRGFKKAMYQIPQTLGGTIALAGDAMGSDGMLEYGMKVYDNQSEKIAKVTKESDSLTGVLQRGESGTDWLQNATGYVGGQAITAIATGGLGGFIGSQLAKRGIRKVVTDGVESAVAKQAIARGAKIGAGTALFGSNLVQEAGSIYPEARHVAEEDGREGKLSGSDLTRVAGSALAAAGVDTAMDALMLGRVMNGARKPGESLLRAARREVPLAMAREGITEGIQTGIERWGAQQQLGTADAVRDYVDSMGVGMVGGGQGGALSVIRANKVPESGSLTRAANAGIEDQILQLTNDPQPLISFPDGSVGHKQDLEAYLVSKYPDADERLAARREIMGRDPATGKRAEPEPVEEPKSADNEANEQANLQAWGARHDPVDLKYAQALLAAPGAKGKELMIVPHPKGKGYTLVPSKWLTLDTQARAGALQRGDEGMLPGPSREAPGGAIRVDSEGGAAAETYGEQVRTGDARREQQAADEAAAARQQELGKQTERGAKAVPKPAKAAPADEPAPAPAAPAAPVSIMNKVGKPFMSEFAAKRAHKEGYADTHDITAADEGGWILTPKEAKNADAAVPTPVDLAEGSNPDAAGAGSGKPKGVKKAVQKPGKRKAAAAGTVAPADAAAVHADPAADAQPALTPEPEWKTNPYTAYKFSIEGGARAFMEKKKVDPAKFEPVQGENGSWALKPVQSSSSLNRKADDEREIEGRATRPKQASDLQALAEHEGSLPQSEKSVLPQLRGEGDNDLPGVGGELSGVSGSSGGAPNAEAHTGQKGERRELRAKKHPVADKNGASEQPAQERVVDGARRDKDSGAMGARSGTSSEHTAQEAVAGADAGTGDIQSASARKESLGIDPNGKKSNAKNDDVPASGNANEPGAAEGDGQQQGGSAGAADPAGEPVSERDVSDRPAKTKKPIADKHAGKSFGDQGQAEAYLTKNKIRDTHRIENTGRDKYEIKPKDGKKVDWRAKVAKQEAALAKQLATAEANAAARGKERISIGDLVAESKAVGMNAAGEPLYENKRGMFRMRMDRKDQPDGFADFGGDLAPTVKEAQAPDIERRAVLEHTIEVAQEEIENDISSGMVDDGELNSFSDLHEFTDANMYVSDASREDRRIGPLGKARGWKMEEYIVFTSEAINAIDAWLKAGRTGDAIDYLPAAAAPSKVENVPVGNDSAVIPSGNETEAEPQDTGADIPRAFFKKVKVSTDVWIEEEKAFESVEMTADRALKEVREDIANYKALLKCMKG
jgi:hypothetical protein